MIYSFFQKLRHVIVTLRFSILSIFITLFVITILLLIILSSHRATHVSLFVADNLMAKMSDSIIEDIQNEFIWVSDGNKLTAKLIQDKVINVQDIPRFLEYLVEFTKHFELVQTVFWADEMGNFILIEEEPQGKIIAKIMLHNQNPPIKNYSSYTDSAHLQLVSTSQDVFDPRQKIWYTTAKVAEKTILTDIYETFQKRQLAMAICTPVYENNKNILRGVIGFSMHLDFISNYLAQQSVQNGISFIANTQGKLIATSRGDILQTKNKLSDIENIKLPWVKKAFAIYQKNKQSKFSFAENGRVYLAKFAVVPETIAKDWVVGIVIPQDEFTGEITKASLIDTAIGLIILALGILIVSNLVTRVVDPIKKLVKQTNKIKNFDLHDEKKVRSRIKEVILLSNAIYSLRVGLKSFQKYVPANLVRQLIEAGEDVRIGGSKKELTIIFSDIENFTSLAERLEPNQLMEDMCEYFDTLTKTISEFEGTIDKYIGDSVMAFWGAPLVVDNPHLKAARAVLKCAKALNKLNESRENQGKAKLITRFGIHTGDAIVGNVGSSERLNYTALGDAINVTSRLEDINKLYGTQIMVSDVFYDLVKDHFVFRKIDRVAFKGKAIGTNIYELLAETKKDISFDVDQYEKVFELGFNEYLAQNWDIAISYFVKASEIYPEDKVSRIFIKRCMSFKITPPKNWDGIFRVN